MSNDTYHPTTDGINTPLESYESPSCQNRTAIVVPLESVPIRRGGTGNLSLAF